MDRDCGRFFSEVTWSEMVDLDQVIHWMDLFNDWNGHLIFEVQSIELLVVRVTDLK